MENIFEQASRGKLRFITNRGNLTTEDLWDLSLEQLDEIARGVNKVVKEASSESFIKKQTTGNKKLELVLAVVVSIINTKLEEEEKRKTAAERKVKRERLLELIAKKEDDATTRKSITSLKAELEKLEDEAE